MNVTMIRATVKPESVHDLEAAARAMFSALEERQPGGVRYASSRLPGGTTYVILLALEQPAENPLPSIPEFQAFQQGLRSWLAEAPTAEQLSVIGSYRLF